MTRDDNSNTARRQKLLNTFDMSLDIKYRCFPYIVCIIITISFKISLMYKTGYKSEKWGAVIDRIVNYKNDEDQGMQEDAELAPSHS